MKIDKLHLQNYGKFHDKDITLTPGVNIILGGNEAGKTTAKDFIIDMLYGIDKARGVGARFDHYEKRRPINGVAYSGSMEFSTENGEYILERNFSKSEKRTTLRNADTGREVTLKRDHDILGTVLETDKSTYLNTLCIGQLETTTDKSIADKLNHYIVNMASSKAGDIDSINAITELKKKRREFVDKEAEEKIAEITAKLQLDRDYDAELEAVRAEYRELDASLNKKGEDKIQFTPIKNAATQEEEERQKRIREEEERQREEREPLSKREKDIRMLNGMGPKSILDNLFVIFLFALIIVAAFVGVAYVVPVSSPKVKMGIMGFGVALSLLMTIQIFARRSALYKLLDELEIERGFEEARSDVQSSISDSRRGEMVDRLAELKVKQEMLLKERGEQELYMNQITELKSKSNANVTELEAIDLAIRTIQELSEEIYDSFGGVLNTQVSEIVSQITKGKYTEVRIDDQLRVMVKSGSSFISMDYLSMGTVEQIYLALRLSIANVLVNEDLPIIIDDIFVTYDEERLRDTLSCIGEYLNRQIIIFTTNSKIQDIFNSLGVPNYSINL
ncbi:MAG: AAA family ATPase [Lachnospiraceae bacterium]|nr:AAA family ATPase [Lachnospiraceae bacterium]